MRCADDPLTEDSFFIIRSCADEDMQIGNIAPRLHATTKRAAGHVISYLDLKMGPIEFVHTLFHLRLMEPYELGCPCLPSQLRRKFSIHCGF